MKSQSHLLTFFSRSNKKRSAFLVLPIFLLVILSTITTPLMQHALADLGENNPDRGVQVLAQLEKQMGISSSSMNQQVSMSPQGQFSTSVQSRSSISPQDQSSMSLQNQFPTSSQNQFSMPSQSQSAMSLQNQFSTLPPGATLPGDADCASRVSSSGEQRPDNNTANHSVPTPQQIAGLAPWGPSGGMDARADALRQRITGNYTGTTDQIIQWVSCKWGIDTNLLRAQAVQESSWHQNHLGDPTGDYGLCPPGGAQGDGVCYQSYGLLQVKYRYNQSAWPMSRDDTAFSVDYAGALMRACYEGWTDYLYAYSPTNGYPTYHAGDMLGCMGVWFSGNWYDGNAISYVNLINQHFANQEWTQGNF
ncbi:MAG: hypothetical protein JO202_18885 [Ktedonobacteraceae bacterium]|nr:hypothetical protein [Ktedonobacteraceae bacterium]